MPVFVIEVGPNYQDDPHDEDCYDEDTGDLICDPCLKCGAHHCPGYCDDYQTYNLRPGETGGSGNDS